MYLKEKKSNATRKRRERQPFPFLALPSEIRLQVYKFNLVYPRYDRLSYYNLTCTCHQIRAEALPLILGEKHIAFQDLDTFVDWVQRGNTSLLCSFRRLSLIVDEKWLQSLQDSFEPEIGATLLMEKDHEFDASSTPVFASNFDALKFTSSCIKALPNIEELFLRFSEGSRRHRRCITSKFRPEQELVLDMVSSTFTNLTDLALISDIHSLTFMRRFKNLKSFCFSGHSLSSPDETLTILGTLKYLRHLELIQGDLGRDAYLSNEEPEYESLSITPNVIAQMNPLISLDIRSDEHDDPFRTVPFDIPLMNSLNFHAKTLKTLTVQQEFTWPIDYDSLLSLLGFVATTPIAHLQLDLVLPEDLARRDIKALLPPTLKEVDIWLRTEYYLMPRGKLGINTGRYLPDEYILNRRVKDHRVEDGSTIPCMIIDYSDSFGLLKTLFSRTSVRDQSSR